MSQSRLHYISSLPLYSKKYSKRKVMKPKIWYITIVSLESVENATVLAALTFIVSGALIGAFISISTYVALAINSWGHTQETKSNCSNSAHHSSNTFDNLLCCYTYSRLVTLPPPLR